MSEQTKTLYYPEYILYDYCCVQLPSILKTQNIGIITKVDKIININDYIDLLKNTKVSNYEVLNNSNVKFHNYLIENGLTYVKNTFGDEYSEIIKNELLTLTFYNHSLEEWNITNLARKYSLTGYDIFVAFVSPLNKSNDNDRLNLLKNDFEKILSESNDSYAYFDYYNNKYRVKNKFPSNIYDDNYPFLLNMRRYEDGIQPLGYHKIFTLVINNIIKSNYK